MPAHGHSRRLSPTAARVSMAGAARRTKTTAQAKAAAQAWYEAWKKNLDNAPPPPWADHDATAN